uniref:DUF4795 domain-containing protein n=1 Tax=Canis lupus familiaris TaxID=9615 RepID=A0A8C0PL79_CANLF
MPPTPAASTVSLRELADLAIGTPEAGAVNFTALHTLIVAMLRSLNLQELRIDFQSPEPEPEPPPPPPPPPQAVVSAPQLAAPQETRPAALESQVKGLGGQVHDLSRRLKTITSQVQGIVSHVQHLTAPAGLAADPRDWLDETVKLAPSRSRKAFQRIDELEKIIRERDEFLDLMSRKLSLMPVGEEVTMVTWEELEQAITDGWRASQGGSETTTGLPKRKAHASITSNDGIQSGVSIKHSSADPALDTASGYGSDRTSSGVTRERSRGASATAFPGREHPRARDEAGLAKPHHPSMSQFRKESDRRRMREPQLHSLAHLRKDEREAHPGPVQQDLASVARDWHHPVYPDQHGEVSVSQGHIYSRPDQHGLGPLGMDQLPLLQPSTYPHGVVPHSMGQLGVMPPGMDEQGLVLPGMDQQRGMQDLAQLRMGQNVLGQLEMDQHGLVQPEMDQRGLVQPGAGQPSLVQPVASQRGLVQPGIDQYDSVQLGMDQRGLVQPGAGQPSLVQPGAGQRGLIQPGMDQYSLVQPGIGQPSLIQPGGQPGLVQHAMDQYGLVQPGIAQHGLDQHGLTQPGAGQRGLVQPAMDQRGLVQPGAGQLGQPGLVQRGMDQHGLVQPDAGQPGLVQPAMDQHGLVQPGMDQRGLVQPDAGQPGLVQPGMDQHGLVQPDASQPGLVQPAMDQRGLVQPGAGQPGMDQRGLVQPGTAQPGLVQHGAGQPGLVQRGAGQPGLVQPAMDQRGLVQPGAGWPGLVQPGMDQHGFVQPGIGQPGLVQPGTDQRGLVQPGTAQPGLVQYGAGQPGLVQRGAGQPGLVQPEMDQRVLVQPDASQPGLVQPVMDQRGLVQPGAGQPGLVQPGTDQRGLVQPGAGQPGMDQHGLVQPGTAQPGLVQRGVAQPGLVQRGAGQPGLVQPAMDQRGLVQPGAGRPGLVQPGMDQRGLVQPDASQPGLVQPGMDQSGLVQPGAGQPALVQPGAGQPALVRPGMDQRGLVQPGAVQPALVRPGMDQRGLVQLRPGQPGLIQPEMDQHGLVQRGVARPGLVQPGAGQPGLVQPRMDQRGLVQPGAGQPGLVQSGVGQPGLVQLGAGGLVQRGVDQHGLVQAGTDPRGFFQPGTYPPGLVQPSAYPPSLVQPGAYLPGLVQPGAYPRGLVPPGAYPRGLAQPGTYPHGFMQPSVDQRSLVQPGIDQRGLRRSGTEQQDLILPGTELHGSPTVHPEFPRFVSPHPYQHGVIPPGRYQYGQVSPLLAEQGLVSAGIGQGLSETYQQGLMHPGADQHGPTPLSTRAGSVHLDQQHLTSLGPDQHGQVQPGTEQHDHAYSIPESRDLMYPPGLRDSGVPGVDQHVQVSLDPKQIYTVDQPGISVQTSPGQEATSARSTDYLNNLYRVSSEKSDFQSERHDSLDKLAPSFPMAVETFRLMGEIIGLYVELKENMKELNEEQAGQTDLEKIQYLLALMVKKSIPPDLQEQLKTLKSLTKEVRQEKAKLDRMQRILEGDGEQEIGKEMKDGQLSLQLGILRVTVADIEKELAELRESQERGKVSMEHSVSEASLYLQDQLDKLRTIIESMLASSSTLLSMSMAPSKTLATLVPGQIDPEATCPACSLDLSHQVSTLVQRYEQLQDMVNNLAASRPSKKAKLQSQDEELLGHVQSAILQVQGDCEKLNITTSNLIEDHRQKQKDIDVLYHSLEKLEKEKANREHLEMEIDVKADKSALAAKVSRVQFDATTEQLNHMMQELVAKMSGQEQDWQKMLDKLLAEMDSKLDRLELDPVKRSLEDRWQALRRQLKERSPLYQADEAAAMRRWGSCWIWECCVSLSNPPLLSVPAQNYPVMPVGPGLPGHRSIRPYTIFELEQVRQQSRSLKLGSAPFPRGDLAHLERSVGRLRTMHSKMLMDIEKVQIHFGGSVKASSQMIRELLQAQCLSSPCYKRVPETADYTYSSVPRRCGGSHTLTYPYRRNRLQHPSQGLYPTEEVQIAMKHDEVDILGLDGHIYKGRMDTRLPGILSKDSECPGGPETLPRDSSGVLLRSPWQSHKAKQSRPHVHRQQSLSDNSQLPSRPQSAQMLAGSSSAPSQPQKDRPVSSEGHLSQPSVAHPPSPNEMANLPAGPETHRDVPPGEGLEEPTRGPRSTAH